jgi:hypothetical protein
MKILLEKCSAKLERVDIFKPTIGNESLHQDSNDNDARLEKFYIKNLVKSTTFPHRNFHKYTWTSPYGNTHNQTGHILIDRRWHSSVLDVRSFGRAECDHDQHLVTKFRERLTVSKQKSRNFDLEKFNLRKLS